MRYKHISKAIYKHIEKCFISDETIELADYIRDNSDVLICECDLDADEKESFLDDCADSASSNFEKIADEIYKIHENKDFSRVQLFKENGFFYIKKSNFAINSDCAAIDMYYDILNQLSASEDKSKGRKYEEFCERWLREFCKDTYLTPGSNDKGIDLVGTFVVDAGFDSQHSFSSIQLLVQIKLYQYQVDTPVIRQLISDCLFQSFSENGFSMFKPTAFCVIAHNGFNNEATKFAKEHHVMLLDSKMMLNILAKKYRQLDNLECIKYLKTLSF